MLKNYLLVAARHLLKYKSYTAIRLAGLSVGMACFLLILLFVGHEYGANRQFSSADRTYLAKSIWHEQGEQERFLSFAPLAEALRSQFAGVENAVRYTAVDADFIVGDTPFRSSTIIAEPNLFEVFDFEFLHGDRLTSLRQPYSAVLSETEALRYFGRTDVVGESIRIAGWDSTRVQQFRITGVLAEPEYNSVSFIGREAQQVYIPFDQVGLFFDNADFESDWGIYNLVTFVQLHDGAKSADIDKQLPALLQAHLPDALQDRVSLRIEPLLEVHLNENNGAVGRLIRLLLVIGLLILMIACFNFVNISISLATVRSREVGLRKVLGAGKKQLVGQFIGESLVVSVAGMLLALLFVFLVLPAFNGLVGRELSLDVTSPLLWGMVAAVTLVTALISGAYPAVFMTMMSPIRALKEVVRTGVTGMRIRQSLVVLQFVVAIGMIIGAVFITRQVSYIANLDVGFDKDRVFVVSSLPRTWTPEGVQQLDVIKREVKEIPGVENASVAWGPPGPRYTGLTYEFAKEGQGPEEAISIPLTKVDPDFLETVGIDLWAGQFFDAAQPENEPVVVLNQAAIRAFGWEEDAVGQYLSVGETNYRVMGVVADYNTMGLEQPIGPVALMDVRQLAFYRELLVRVQPGTLSSVQEQIGEVWRTVYPDVVLESYVVEAQWAEMHRWIDRTEEITRLAAGLSMFIALLGLLGLVSISIGQRKREIGIRKVLGATFANLIGLLSREYLVLIGIALVLAVPVTYIGVSYWLGGFVQRINIDAGPFVLTGLALAIGAYLTVGVRTLRASRVNPVDSLRRE